MGSGGLDSRTKEVQDHFEQINNDLAMLKRKIVALERDSEKWRMEMKQWAREKGRRRREEQRRREKRRLYELLVTSRCYQELSFWCFRNIAVYASSRSQTAI